MDIGNVGFALNTLSSVESGSLAATVSTAMLDKALETNESYGDAVTKMMERSVNPQVGGNIDVYA